MSSEGAEPRTCPDCGEPIVRVSHWHDQRNPEGAERRQSMPVSLPGMALHRIKQRDRIHGEPCYCEADAAEVIRWHKAEPSSLDAPCRHQYPHDGPCE